jgi:hypothetical protein
MYQRASQWAGFREILYWGRLRKSVEKLQICFKPEKNFSLLDEYISTFVLLTPVLNILQGDKSEKGIHCCVSMANLSSCMLSIATCTSPPVQGNVLSGAHPRGHRAAGL